MKKDIMNWKNIIKIAVIIGITVIVSNFLWEDFVYLAFGCMLGYTFPLATLGEKK